jgi:hypothetical protein
MGESLNTAWVTDDGSYGDGEIIYFEPEMLTDIQWERLTDMSDNSRIKYVRAIMDFDDKAVREIEMLNFGEEWGL